MHQESLSDLQESIKALEQRFRQFIAQPSAMPSAQSISELLQHKRRINNALETADASTSQRLHGLFTQITHEAAQLQYKVTATASASLQTAFAEFNSAVWTHIQHVADHRQRFKPFWKTKKELEELVDSYFLERFVQLQRENQHLKVQTAAQEPALSDSSREPSPRASSPGLTEAVAQYIADTERTLAKFAARLPATDQAKATAKRKPQPKHTQHRRAHV